MVLESLLRSNLRLNVLNADMKEQHEFSFQAEQRLHRSQNRLFVDIEKHAKRQVSANIAVGVIEGYRIAPAA